MSPAPRRRWRFEHVRPLATAPGSRAPSDGMLRPVGTASSTCRVSTTCCTALCTSTTGDAPVTLIVSSSAPTFISPLMVAVKLVGSSTASRLKVLKPGSEKVTE